MSEKAEKINEQILDFIKGQPVSTSQQVSKLTPKTGSLAIESYCKEDEFYWLKRISHKYHKWRNYRGALFYPQSNLINLKI
jgi:poly-D-alanine transfer protein DltD